MRVYRYTLAAGASQIIHVPGDSRFIRGYAGAERYELRIGEGAPTEFETGVAVQTAAPFSKLTITNTAAASQEVAIAVGAGLIEDNRMVGTMDLNGAIGILTTAAVAHTTHPVQTISTATDVLAANSDRRSATVQLSGECYIDGATDGVLVSGNLVWESQTALNLEPKTGTVEVRILEETNA